MSTKQPQCYVIAVSGGVDSVVLLDMMQKQNNLKLVVAHVDHGIRPESTQDAEFVRGLAEQYGLLFESIALHLGPGASELSARNARYNFLREVARRYGGKVVTAHHADDLVETVVLNLQRGTGWRGLAVFGANDIYRPLTRYFKDELLAYANRHSLDWREDATNHEPYYARNKIRPLVAALPKSTRLEIMALWREQQAVATRVDTETQYLATNERHFYIMAPPLVAREVLQVSLKKYGDISCTRPQLDAMVLACKTARPGTRHSINKDWTLVFSQQKFRVEHR